MQKIINMILEMVLVSGIVVFLLNYLFYGGTDSGQGIMHRIGNSVDFAEQNTLYELKEDSLHIMTSKPGEVICSLPMVELNHPYAIEELFIDKNNRHCYMEISDIQLEHNSVLARGDKEILLTEEIAPAAIFDEKEQVFLFTRTGDYTVFLRVGTEYGRKPYKEIEIIVPAILAKQI